MRWISLQSLPLDKTTILINHSLDIPYKLSKFPPSNPKLQSPPTELPTMTATMATSMAILNAKFLNTNPSKPVRQLLSIKNLPRGLATAAPSQNSAAITSSAIAGAIFSTLSAANPAFAAQQLAEIADGDNRGLALLIPLIPAVLWVLYNILQPALNQLNKMRSSKGVIIGLGLAASGLFHPPEASAGEIAAVADNRGTLLLFVVTPALLWVLYNILQPALNQLNRMRSD